MDRAEKRRLERERQKLNGLNMKEDEVNRQWYSQLSVSRKIFIGKFVERRTIENDNLVAAIMDKCMFGSMDDNTSIDIKLMKKVVDDCNGYILDYKEFLDKYGDGGFDMIENETVKSIVKDRMIKYISEGITKVKAMAILKKEFNFPAIELSDMWVECKDELKVDVNDSEVKKINTEMVSSDTLNKAREHMEHYIKSGNSQANCILWVRADFNLEDNIIIDLWNECIKQAESTHRPITDVENELEVVEITKVVKGRFGYYHVSKDGLRFSTDAQLVNYDIAYKTKDEVIDSWYAVSRDIENDIIIMEKKLESLKKDKDIAFSKFKELEKAFDM